VEINDRGDFKNQHKNNAISYHETMIKEITV